MYTVAAFQAGHVCSHWQWLALRDTVHLTTQWLSMRVLAPASQCATSTNFGSVENFLVSSKHSMDTHCEAASEVVSIAQQEIYSVAGLSLLPCRF